MDSQCLVSGSYSVTMLNGRHGIASIPFGGYWARSQGVSPGSTMAPTYTMLETHPIWWELLLSIYNVCPAPPPPGRITLRDLKRCKLSHIFFDTFFNIEKYLDHEQKDPFSVIRVSRAATTRGSRLSAGRPGRISCPGVVSCCAGGGVGRPGGDGLGEVRGGGVRHPGGGGGG